MNLLRQDSNASPSSARKGGFTLLEVMVALLLLAVMAVLSWRALDAMVHSRDRVAAHDLSFDAARHLFGSWDQDCAALGTPDAWLVGVPVVFASQRVTLIRLRMLPFGATQWVLVSYRWQDGRVERLESPPLQSLAQLQALWGNLQAGQALEELMAVEPVTLMTGTLGLEGAARLSGANWSRDVVELNRIWRLPIPQGNALLLGLDLSVQLAQPGTVPLHKYCLSGQS